MDCRPDLLLVVDFGSCLNMITPDKFKGSDFWTDNEICPNEIWLG